MKRIAFKMLMVVALLPVCTGARAQKTRAAEPGLDKPYWLNYSLIFLDDCRPVVSPRNIVFAEGDCQKSSPSSGKIFPKAAKVKLYSVTRGENFSKVRFRHWPEIYELDAEYELILRSDSETNFIKSFRLLFSEREFRHDHGAACPDDVKTKAQVIKCMGFPISVSKSGDAEKYSYILEFAGFGYLGYDGWTIEIKNGKVINVSGYI